MENKKVTKREMYNEVVAIATELGREDLVEFANHEIELLDKKKSSGKQTATQKANEEIKVVLVDTLKANPNKSITELQTINTDLANYSNQKISALLTQLVKADVVARNKEGKKSVFRVI